MKLRKDLLCTLLAVAVVLLCFVALPQTAQATGASQPVKVIVSASHSTMCWGKEITVTVSTEEVNNCWVGGFFFEYDKDVFEYVRGEALVSNWAASGVSDANGKIAGYFMDEDTKAKNIEGNLFQITLKVKEGAAAGNYEISGQATFVTVSGDVKETLTCNVTAKIVTVGHDWNPATCTVAKTCETCGETDGAALAHAYTGEGGKCANGCGKTCTENNDHAYTNADGTCANGCGKTVCENTGSHTPGAAASCLANQTCTTCGAELNGKLDHAYGQDGKCTNGCGKTVCENDGCTEAAIPAVPATCTSTGWTAGVKCSVCETIKTAPTETSKLDHAYGQDGKCTNGCGKTVCENDGCTEVAIPAVPATCTSTGWTAGVKCSVCETIKTAPTETSKLDHAYGQDGKCTNGCGKTVCENDGCTEAAIPAVPATCTSTGWTAGVKCSVCETIKTAPTETSKLEHAYGQDGKCTNGCGKTVCENDGCTEAAIPAVPATCTSTGWTAGVKCSVCETIKTAPTETSKLEHAYGQDGKCTNGCGKTVCENDGCTEAAIPAVPATCTSTGWTAGVKCSVCETIKTAPTETSKLDHAYGQDGKCTNGCGKTVCENTGSHTPNKDDGDCTTAITCSVCNKVTTSGAAQHDWAPANLTAPMTCKVCGKTQGDVATCNHEPEADDGDCTTAINCSKCGEVAIPAAAAHTPAEDDGDCTTAIACTVCGKETTPAAAAHTPATDDGDCTTAIACTVCGKETTPAAAAHTPAADDGDCTTAIACTVCGKETTPAAAAHTPAADDGDCTTAIACTVCGKETTPAAAAHTPAADDGDCTTAIACTVCGKVTAPAAAAHTPAADDGDCTTAIACTVCGKVTAPAAAHTPAADDGDCTTAIACTVCGKVTTPAAAAHTPATDDGDCTTAIACTVCGKVTTPAKEHTWLAATTTTPKTCKDCGKTEGGPATCDHTWVETTAAVAATCETAGKTAVKTCSVCNKTEGGEEIAALGHNMVETTAAVAATCETAGKTAILTCSHNCGATEGGEEIPATGHQFEDGVCSACGQTDYIAGDVDGSEEVTQDDVVYLLLHTLFGEEEYPMNDAPADIDGNGLVEERDVVYLLLHTLFDEPYYPLKREEF